jgi:EAL domain-containing protein (putative c-di-GMP-specific phosphodiesterase class I)/FixJ family two-component response regulator
MIPMAGTPANIAHLSFLVVEDHGFQRWVTGNLLEGMGAKAVFSAGDGGAALELLAGLDSPVDIIVSDLDMPGMDGMEFIRHVGEAGQPISLILASGLDRSLISSVETMARAYGLTLLGAIEKPPTAKKLKAAIDLYRPARVSRPSSPASAFTIAEITKGVKDNEFEPFFQPKVELATRQVKGAEAVARWRHPTKGVIGPHEFIQPLEDAGLLEDLTEMILKKAAACCRIWRNGGLQASVSVNLSLKSLADVGLADRMMRISHGQGLQPRHLIFEVTESAAATDLGKALENLSRLRMKGFGLSIDDYGTGYSSMQQLTRVAFTELKIDQSFVRNAATQKSSRAMLESSLEMAAKLKIVAVAEGIETQDDWNLLLELGCQLGQGYFIAKPMDAGEFLDWIRVRRSLE